MSGERYTTPAEDSLLRMVSQAGSPEAAAQNLFARLEALEALAAQVEAEQEAALGEATEEAATGDVEPSSPVNTGGEGSTQ